jgi:hypothetical protein
MAVAVFAVCLLWLGVLLEAIRQLRRPGKYSVDVLQVVASGLTINVAVEAGDPPAWAGFPLILIGCALVVAGVVRAVRQKKLCAPSKP